MTVFQQHANLKNAFNIWVRIERPVLVPFNRLSTIRLFDIKFTVLHP